MKYIYQLMWRILVRQDPQANALTIKGLGHIKHLAKNTDDDLVIIVDGAGKLD